MRVSRTTVLPAAAMGALLLGGLTMAAVNVASSSQTETPGQVQEPDNLTPAEAAVQAEEEVEGSLPKDEVGPLKAAALAEPELAARARTSSRLELLWANVVAGRLDNGSPKNGPCLGDSCAELVFYDWDGRFVISVTLERGSARVLKLEEGPGRPWLTPALKKQAADIAAADPLVAPLLTKNHFVGLVADMVGVGSCATNFCALVGFGVGGDSADPQVRAQSITVDVDLTRGIVVYAPHPSINIDRRFEQ